jgi:hypothetical protein
VPRAVPAGTLKTGRDFRGAVGSALLPPPIVANTDASLQGRITTRRIANGKADREPTDASHRWATDPDPANRYTQAVAASRDGTLQGYRRRGVAPSPTSALSDARRQAQGRIPPRRSVGTAQAHRPPAHSRLDARHTPKQSASPTAARSLLSQTDTSSQSPAEQDAQSRVQASCRRGRLQTTDSRGSRCSRCSSLCRTPEALLQAATGQGSPQAPAQARASR